MSVRQRTETKSSENPRATKKLKVQEEAEPKVGTVSTFAARRGYGFISQDDGPDVFFHQSQIHTADPEGFPNLQVGQSVEFTAACGDDGRWKATKVTGPGGALIATKGRGKKGQKGQSGRESKQADLGAKVKKQIEYYLSDKNLTRDLWMRKFFVADGAIAISNLLKCNKLKALTKDVAVIESSVKESKVLHMTTVPNASKTGREPAVARGPSADNVTALPEYTPPMVLLMTELTSGESAPTWKDIRVGFLAAYSAPLFVYLTHETPFIVVNGSKDVIPRAVAGGVKDLEGKQLCALAESKSQDQSEALLKHHYDQMAKASKGRRRGKDRRRGREKKAAVEEGPVLVGDEKYPNRQDIFDKVKAIMKQYKNNTVLLGEDKKFIMLLLNAHPRAKEKLKFARNVMIKDNANYEGASRCFHIIKKDGALEDISYVKCINNLPSAS